MRRLVACADIAVVGRPAWSRVAPAAGAPEQTPKRGGTVVVGVKAEPACLNPVDRRCGFPSLLQKVLEPAFALAPDFTPRPRLVAARDVHEEPPFTRDVPRSIPMRAGATGFRSRRATSSSPTGRSSSISHPSCRCRTVTFDRSRAVGAKTVKVVLRERTADWRYPLLPRACRSTRSGAGPSRRSGATGSRIPRTGAPIGAARSSSPAGSAGSR